MASAGAAHTRRSRVVFLEFLILPRTVTAYANATAAKARGKITLIITVVVVL
jgi:hypothetical protein